MVYSKLVIGHGAHESLARINRFRDKEGCPHWLRKVCFMVKLPSECIFIFYRAEITAYKHSRPKAVVLYY